MSRRVPRHPAGIGSADPASEAMLELLRATRFVIVGPRVGADACATTLTRMKVTDVLRLDCSATESLGELLRPADIVVDVGVDADLDLHHAALVAQCPILGLSPDTRFMEVSNYRVSQDLLGGRASSDRVEPTLAVDLFAVMLIPVSMALLAGRPVGSRVALDPFAFTRPGTRSVRSRRVRTRTAVRG